MAHSTVVAIIMINVFANFFVISKELIYILKTYTTLSKLQSQLYHSHCHFCNSISLLRLSFHFVIPRRAWQLPYQCLENSPDLGNEQLCSLLHMDWSVFPKHKAICT